MSQSFLDVYSCYEFIYIVFAFSNVNYSPSNTYLFCSSRMVDSLLTIPTSPHPLAVHVLFIRCALFIKITLPTFIFPVALPILVYYCVQY